MQLESVKELIGKQTLQQMAVTLNTPKSTLKRFMKKNGLKQDPEFTKTTRLSNSIAGGNAFGDKVRLTPEEKKQRTKSYNRNRRRKGYHLKYTPIYKIKRYAMKMAAIAYKGGKCQECGYSKCIAALEFHHRDPDEKDFGLNEKRYWFKSIKELDKCDLLCANCHRENHYEIVVIDMEALLSDPKMKQLYDTHYNKLLNEMTSALSSVGQ